MNAADDQLWRYQIGWPERYPTTVSLEGMRRLVELQGSAVQLAAMQCDPYSTGSRLSNGLGGLVSLLGGIRL